MNKDNLYTGGNEFKLPNGKFYVGKYHIHQSMGAMVGATHSGNSQQRLTPATAKAQKKVQSTQSKKTSFITSASNRSRPQY
jgi:hypothetical protein